MFRKTFLILFFVTITVLCLVTGCGSADSVDELVPQKTISE